MSVAMRSQPSSIADRVEIAPGVEMPRLGLGTSRALGRVARDAILAGLQLGYRLIDTAAAYRNEREVGEAVRASGVSRADVFITTKVWNSDQGYDRTLRAFEESRARLGVDYVDLYLIHWPQPGRTRETWRALERIHAEGGARAIGVSNFERHDFDEFLGEATIRPAVNQIEFHPLLQRSALVSLCERLGITVEAWSPLIRGRIDRLPELAEIGARHGKTAAQVTLRWDLQRGVVTIPKSAHAQRLRENADIFDFELTPAEMAAIDALDAGGRRS